MRLAGYIRPYMVLSITAPVYTDGANFYFHSIDSDLVIQGFSEFKLENEYLIKYENNFNVKEGKHALVVIIDVNGSPIIDFYDRITERLYSIVSVQNHMGRYLENELTKIHDITIGWRSRIDDIMNKISRLSWVDLSYIYKNPGEATLHNWQSYQLSKARMYSLAAAAGSSSYDNDWSQQHYLNILTEYAIGIGIIIKKREQTINVEENDPLIILARWCKLPGFTDADISKLISDLIEEGVRIEYMGLSGTICRYSYDLNSSIISKIYLKLFTTYNLNISRFLPFMRGLRDIYTTTMIFKEIEYETVNWYRFKNFWL